MSAIEREDGRERQGEKESQTEVARRMLPFVAELPIPLAASRCHVSLSDSSFVWDLASHSTTPPAPSPLRLPLSLFPIDFVAVKLRREAALGDGLAGEGEGGVLHSMELTTVMGQRQ